MLRLAVLLCAASALTAGCTTTRESVIAGASSATIVRTDPVHAWRLSEDGRTLGWVVQFADPADLQQSGRQYFSVRNELQQELGTIDAFGRTWRFVPHQREAQWLCTGTLAEGARAILGGSAAAELGEIAIEELKRQPLAQR